MKKKIFSILLFIALLLPCVFVLSACGGDSSKTGDNQNGGGSAGQGASYRTTALTLVELGYGGISEGDWRGLADNCFYGKKLKIFQQMPQQQQMKTRELVLGIMEQQRQTLMQ